MAKNSSLLKIEGTLGELTFYKSKDGFLVRTKGGVSKSRIATDPAFSRTRENGREFGQIARSGKVLRDAIRPLLLQAKDSRVTSRLVKVMADVKNADAVSTRGDRTVFEGLSTAAGKAYIKGFDFNSQAGLGSILFTPLTVDPSTGTVSLTGLVPRQQIVAPKGSTHVSLLSAIAHIDFESEDSELQISNLETIALNEVTPQNVELIPATVPTGTGVSLVFFLMSFSQEVNGTLYDLRNGSYNVLHVLDVI